MPNLDAVYDALEDIASNPSRNSKQEKLGRYIDEVPWLKETVEYALNPYKHFYINKIPKPKNKVFDDSPNVIFPFLDSLVAKRSANDVDRQYLADICGESKKTRGVLLKILKKDLRCGVQSKTAKEFIPDLPIYEVMKPYGDNPFPGKQWEKFCSMNPSIAGTLWAMKVDGFRVSYITVPKKGPVEYLSTSGRPYTNFKVFDPEMKELAYTINKGYGVKYPMKFDGEAVTNDGDFQSIQKHARRIYNVDPEVYRLLLWGVVCGQKYIDEYQMLDSLHTTSGEKYDFIDTVNSHKEKVFRLQHSFFAGLNINSTKGVLDHVRKIIEGGNEGIIMKTPYHIHELKRSDHWFRIKALYLKGKGIELDLPVIDFKYGKKGTRLEKMLGSFICEYKGHRVDVSGKLSDDQRREYVKNLPSWIEVNADSETNDGSLRLPIFQRARYDK